MEECSSVKWNKVLTVNCDGFVMCYCDYHRMKWHNFVQNNCLMPVYVKTSEAEQGGVLIIYHLQKLMIFIG
jgi:hypothetical protein